MFPGIGKLFIILGGIFIFTGLVFLFAPHIPWLGRLPGDIHFEGKSARFYFPIVSCIILSVLFTIILNLFRH